MRVTFTAVYDGEVVRPEHKLKLPKGSRYVMTLTRIPEKPEYEQTAWEFLKESAGAIDGKPKPRKRKSRLNGRTRSPRP